MSFFKRPNFQPYALVTRRRALSYLIVLIVFFTALSAKIDYDSCTRQIARSGTRDVAAAAWNARLDDAQRAQNAGDYADARRYRKLAADYLKAWRESPPLDCSFTPLPEIDPDQLKGTPTRVVR